MNFWDRRKQQYDSLILFKLKLSQEEMLRVKLILTIRCMSLFPVSFALLLVFLLLLLQIKNMAEMLCSVQWN